jgi:hypothetical protein
LGNPLCRRGLCRKTFDLERSIHKKATL